MMHKIIVRELAWNPPSRFAGCEFRTVQFVRRSGLPLAAVVAVANAIGARTRELLEPQLQVDVLPPVALDIAQWDALCAGALVYAVRGERGEGALIIGAGDAERIARHAFGETALPSEALSEFELCVLDRFALALAGALDPLFGCARIEHGQVSPCTSFVEVRFGAPLNAAVGIAVARDPGRPPGPKLAAAALEGCLLDCSARLEVPPIAAMKLITLGIGDVLRLSCQGGPAATLNVGECPIATGEGGVVGDLLAFMVRDIQSGTVECPR